MKFLHFASVAVLAVAGGLSAPSCSADSFTVHEALEDTKLYFTAPARWDGQDWLEFGVALAAVGVAHEFDGRVREHFAVGSHAQFGAKDKNSTRDALPTAALVAGTFVYASLLGDSDGYRETWSYLEAGAFSAVSAEVLKFASGRVRPNFTASPDHWRQKGNSFPSLHVTAAFAIGTTFAESGNDEYRWIRRVIGYGIAAGTAYGRLHDNMHWLSDTVAGAALGIATARFVLNRQGMSQHASIQFQPSQDGWMIAYTKAF